MTQPSSFVKDPDANLDYRFDWSQWLEDGDAITEATVTADGVEVGATDNQGDAVVVFLSGGESGTTAEVTCRVTTSDGRIDDRTIRLRIRDR